MTTARARGEAGRKGDDVRSDCYVAFEPADSGGLALDLVSKVEPYYGESLREQVTRVAADLGVEHGRFRIEDGGALPFTVAARLEAAVKRAGLARDRTSLPEALPAGEASSRDRTRRSRLYLPGSEPKFFVNARLHGPDAVILDLEDSVHPGEKDAARILVRNALLALDFSPSERMVRINQLPLGIEDLDAVLPARPDLVLIPKVERPEQVVEVEAKLRAGRREVWIMPILESALGVENAYAIARASERVVALTIGIEDYTADLGVIKTDEGGESEYARRRLVNAARAAGVQAIDSVFGDVGDMEGLLRYGKRSRAMGFEGMGCLHPRQVRVIHEAFAPPADQLERALRIVEAFREAEAKGLGVVSLGSKMIDPPVVKRARKLVEEARRTGLLPEEGR